MSKHLRLWNGECLSNIHIEVDRNGPQIADTLFETCRELFPLNRSVSSPDNLRTLKILGEIAGDIEIKEFAANQKVAGWRVPRRWHLVRAKVTGPDGNLVIDSDKSNLHVFSHSDSCDRIMSRQELEKHLVSDPDNPEAIPYRTNYYGEGWGLCMAHRDRKNLRDGDYHVEIDAHFTEEGMPYGEIFIPGESKKEILLSTYICHPSMASNELSGPVIAAYLAKLLHAKKMRFSYRILFMSETIGAICYINENLDNLRANLFSGYVLTCLGDTNGHSLIEGINPDCKSAYFVKSAMRHMGSANCNIYSFSHRGSDERQYCSPNVNLPVVTLCNTKFGQYPEYHSSLDNMEYVSRDGLFKGLSFVARVIDQAENAVVFESTTVGEPFLSAFGLYPKVGSLSKVDTNAKRILDCIALCDGHRPAGLIAEKLGIPVDQVVEILIQLDGHGIVRPVI